MARRGIDKSAGRSFSKVKDTPSETQTFSRRAAIALLLVFGGMLVLVGRLVYLQVIRHEHFTTLSEDNRVKLEPLAPTRGLIFDRNGILLADNLPTYSLEIIPEEIADLEVTLAQLKLRIELSEPDIQRFRKLLRRHPSYTGIPLRFNLSDDEVARIAVDLHRFPGVNIAARLTRYYPLGSHVVHVIGYVGRIDENELQRIDARQYWGSSHIGKLGIERSYEEMLHGRVGYQHVETNAQGRALRVLEQIPAIPGKNLYLTINSRLQAVAENALAGHTGAIVAIDPRNGEILAMVSLPVFDPNPFVNGIDSASYEVLNNSPDRPLFNRALRGVYPPGSTIKPLLGLAGLEYGITDSSRSVFCSGFYRLPGNSHNFRDWKRTGHGRVDLEKGIVQSCDVYFYDLAFRLGIDRLHDYLDKFNFGRPTGIDLLGEKPGLLPSQAWKRKAFNQSWYAGETVITGIGQGYLLVTPLQLAYAMAVLAQGGRRFQPHLLYAVQPQSGGKILKEPFQPLLSIESKDHRHWKYIVASMMQVVHGVQGTARRIGVNSTYNIAGKTGTAQVFSLGQDERYESKRLAKHLHDHALFVAFAPAEEPRIAIAVIVEHGGGGSTTAAPIAKRILDAHLLSLY